MTCILTKMLMWLLPGYMKRNFVSEDMLRDFLSHVLNPKNVLLNWLRVRSCDYLHERAVLHYNFLMAMPHNGTYDEELNFMQRHPFHMSMFPYETVRASNVIKTGIDHGLPFVLHKQDKLYFPKCWTTKIAASDYRAFVEEEGILGNGCLRKSPHSYITDCFKVEPEDVLLDVGSAEGLFALDNMNIASKVYIFESLKIWRKPLAATFGKFGDKVILVNKRVGREVSADTTTLTETVKDGREDAVYFIKMDIEGAEREVVCASESFLRNHRVKLACAAYHRQDDADFLKRVLEEMGFHVQFSDGYMLPVINDFIYPYFRRGMIYARNY